MIDILVSQQVLTVYCALWITVMFRGDNLNVPFLIYVHNVQLFISCIFEFFWLTLLVNSAGPVIWHYKHSRSWREHRFIESVIFVKQLVSAIQNYYTDFSVAFYLRFVICSLWSDYNYIICLLICFSVVCEISMSVQRNK